MKNNKYSDYKIFNFSDKIESFKSKFIAPPIYIRIKPINVCNHGCFFCIYSTGFRCKDKSNHIISGMHSSMQESDVIPYIKMMEILKDIKKMGVKAVTYSGGGEPLLHKNICDIMSKTLEYNIDLSIITNGQRLSQERALILANAKWVRISIDYTNSAQMKEFRNVDESCFDEIIANINHFSKIKNNNCDLSVNYIVHKENYKNLYEFVYKLKDNGVDNVRISPMWIPDYYKYHKLIFNEAQNEMDKIHSLIDNKFSVNTTYSIAENTSHSIDRTYDKCYIMETVPVIGADLGVYTCHNKAYDHAGLIGSLKSSLFSELWGGENMINFINGFNPKISCNHECSNDRKNIIINSFINTSSDNFI